MAIKTQIQEKTGANSYEILHPETVAEQVIEGETRKFMTPSERSKLGGIAAGAQVNIIEKIQLNGENVNVGANKTVNIQIPSDYIKTDQKGVANGVATLDSFGKVPAAQLPSYVDDVGEFANLAAFPATGESGKIYVAKDTNKTYRWSGTQYVEISASIALGETSSTAYAGNKGKLNRDDINAIIAGTKKVGSASHADDADHATSADSADAASSATLADKATKLANARTINLGGDATGSASFDGSANVTISATLANSGVTAGTYSAITVDSKGRVTNGMQSVEFGAVGQTTPSASLVIGGLFFKRV